jgi:hypothetical protein
MRAWMRRWVLLVWESVVDAYVERRVLGWVVGVGHWTELA